MALHKHKNEKGVGGSEEQFRQIVEQSSDAISISIEGKIAFINNTGAKILGAKNPESLIGREIMDFLHPDYREIVENRLQKIRVQGLNVNRIEEKFVRLDGMAVDVEIAATPFIYKGKPAVQSIFRDITERKKAEEVMHESEEKFRLAFENAKDAIFWADPKTGLIVNCNKEAENLLERKRDEIVGQSQATLHPPKKAENYIKMFQSHLNQGRVVDDEAEVVTKSGRIITVSITASVTSIGNKQLIQGIFRDITERKKAGEALRESEGNLRSIIESSSDCICHISLDGKFLSMNSAGRRLNELDSDDEMIGESCTVGVVENIESVDAGLKRAALEGMVSVQYKSVNKKGRDIWWDSKITPVRDAQGGVKSILRISRDITEKKKAEDEIRRSSQIQLVLNKLLQISLEDISLDEMLQCFIEQITSISWLSFEAKGSISLVESEPDMLVLKAQRGLPKSLQKICAKVPFGRCICGRAALSREVLFVNCLDERHDNTYDDIPPHGHYCVPILSGSVVLGVINTYVRAGHVRDPREEEFLYAVANTLVGIIKRKKAEAEIRNSREFLNNIIENSGDAIIATDQDGKVTLWSKRAEKLYGYSSKDAVGKNINILYPDEHKEERAQWQKSILAGKTLSDLRTRIYNSSSEPVDINLTLSPLHDSAGTPIGTVGVSRDIADTVESERRVQQKIEELEKWQRLTVGREIRMSELKKEMEGLRERLAKYEKPG